MKNLQDKWWSYGNLKTNQYGNLQASFKIDNLRALLETAEQQGKEWVNLSCFEVTENKKKAHSVAKGNAYVNELEPINDEVPF
jgi:hypothetical protein